MPAATKSGLGQTQFTHTHTQHTRIEQFCWHTLIEKSHFGKHHTHRIFDSIEFGDRVHSRNQPEEKTPHESIFRTDKVIAKWNI